MPTLGRKSLAVAEQMERVREALMTLSTFTASATTCEVVPGDEQVGEEGQLRIRGRRFTDLVQSSEPLLAGVNRPVLDIELDPATGRGQLKGVFVLQPDGVSGRWDGELLGRIEKGLVTASGLARGTGDLESLILYSEFRQTADRPAISPPCRDPQAFFEMEGVIQRED